MIPRIALSFGLVSFGSLLAQDILHYKFDEHCSSEVINFAAGSSVGNATIVTALAGGVAAARTPGQFDEALTGNSFPAGAGTTYLNTGWSPATLTGSFSFSMWIRNKPGNPAAIPFGYLWGTTGGNFRLFTGSSGFLFLSGAPGSSTSNVNLTTLVNAGWVHVACTVDASTLQAIWYTNGVPDAPDTLSSVALAGTNFAIGARETNGSSPSPMDTDEFLLVQGVLTPAEVLALSLAPRAGDGDYTAGIASQCGAGNVVLGSAGGTPAVGNLGYSFTVTTATPSLFLLLAGFDRCNFGGAIPLPLDGTPILPLLNGCWILADAPVILNGVAVGTPGIVAFPLPPTVPLGVSLYTQALGLDLATFASSMSSGFATSTGI